MQILHITEASAAGTLQVVRTLARAQAAGGHEVTLAYADRPETPADIAQDAGVELVPLRWSRRSPRSQLSAARRVRELARERRPDVVHLHSSFAGAVGALALPRGTTVVYTPHGLAAGRTGSSRAVRAAETLVARRATLVGAVSEAEAEAARRLLRARRVAVVPNGIPELDTAPPAAAPERAEPVAVAMGRITAARRPAATARILSALAPAARVAWIGAADPGEDDTPVRAAGVPVTGWLPRAEVLERLGEATVYVHWSAWDGQSLAILEAIARDVVVVASDIPANREVLGTGQVRADEASAIALARAVLQDSSLRADLLSEQRRRAPAFAASRMATEWLNLYNTARPAPGERLQTASSPLTAPKIGGPWT